MWYDALGWWAIIIVLLVVALVAIVGGGKLLQIIWTEQIEEALYWKQHEVNTWRHHHWKGNMLLGITGLFVVFALGIALLLLLTGGLIHTFGKLGIG